MDNRPHGAEINSQLTNIHTRHIKDPTGCVPSAPTGPVDLKIPAVARQGDPCYKQDLLVPMWTINQTNNQTKNPFCWKMPVVLFDFWWYINTKSRHGKSTLKSFLLISSLGKQLIRNLQVEYELWCSASSLFQHISQSCREPDLPTKRGLSSSISAESLLHVETKLWCSRKAVVQTSHSMRYQSRIMTQPRNIALGYSPYNPTALPGDLE